MQADRIRAGFAASRARGRLRGGSRSLARASVPGRRWSRAGQHRIDSVLRMMTAISVAVKHRRQARRRNLGPSLVSVTARSLISAASASRSMRPPPSTTTETFGASARASVGDGWRSCAATLGVDQRGGIVGQRVGEDRHAVVEIDTERLRAPRQTAAPRVEREPADLKASARADLHRCRCRARAPRRKAR